MTRIKSLIYRLEDIYLKIVFEITNIIMIISGYIFSIFIKKKNKPQYWQKVAKVALLIVFLLSFIRVNVKNRKMSYKGPCVIAMNHRSIMDTLSMVMMTDRYLFVVSEPFDDYPNKLLARWAKNQDYLAIFRDEEDKKKFKEGADKSLVVKECVKRLKDGKTLLIYPEGHYERDKGILKFKTGAVRCALEAGVPLIPGYFSGTEKVVTPGHNRIHPGKIIIKFGEPMNLSQYYGKQDDRKLVNYLTNELREEISKLKNLK